MALCELLEALRELLQTFEQSLPPSRRASASHRDLQGQQSAVVENPYLHASGLADRLDAVAGHRSAGDTQLLLERY